MIPVHMADDLEVPRRDVSGRADVAGHPAPVVPLVATKLRAPTLSASVIERPRLHECLDGALDEATRLTVVSAPPGYGKSAAVLGWLASRRLPNAWLSLDPADNDPARFVRYLVAALRTVRPDAGEATMALIGAGTSPSVEILGATLIDEIAAGDSPFVLVLDDYHMVDAEPVHRLVRFLVEHGPPFAHVMLLTREDPPLPLARLRAHGRLVEIRADDLRFRRDEADAYLSRALETDLPAHDVERLVSRTEGWAAGLQLASVVLRDRPDRAALIEAFHGSHRFVIDYLADEVLEHLEPAFRSFLVKTSVAERFTAALCAELTGRADADALLLRADQANLFLVPLDAERHWFRYHRLFGEYLRSQLDADERRVLDLRAADHLERHGLTAEAIAHALAAGADDRAADLVATAARPAFESGELSTLLAWIEALPRGAVLARPEIGSLEAWALFLAGRLPEAGRVAQRALAALPPAAVGGEPEGRLLSLRALAIDLTSADAATAEPLARAGLDQLAGDPFFRAMALLALAEVWLSTDRLVPGIALLRDALEVALPTRQPMAIMPTVYLLAIALNAKGARQEAESLCRRVLEEYADPAGRPLQVAGLARIALGTLRYEANDLVEARRELEQGFQAALEFGFGRFLLGQGAAVLATVRQATGAADAAVDAVKAGTRHARALEMQAMIPQAGAFEAQALLARGDVEGAGRLADDLLGDPDAGSRLIPRARLQRDMALARVRLAQGRPGEARELLDPLEIQARASAADAYLTSVLVLKARASEASGQRSEAVAALDEAVRLAAPGGYVRRLVEDAGPLQALLSQVRSAAPAFVDEVLTGLRDTAGGARPGARSGAIRIPADPGLGEALADPLIETLTARELEILGLMAQGRSNAEIAEELVVSLTTVKWHVGNVLGKLGVRSRTRAIVRAQRLGLV
jgi:LuxR family maltose regulon positive regulatory protein